MERMDLPRCAVWALASGFLVCPSLGISAASDRGRGPPGTDSRLDMVAALTATAPHASLGEEQKALGRVVGAWDVDYLDYLKDGRLGES